MNYSIFVLLIAIYGVFGETGLQFLKDVQEKDKQYCFNFTWVGQTVAENIKCSDPKYKNIPCIEPIEYTLNLPNYTELWARKDHLHYGCVLTQGYSCIKYTYWINKAVVNTTHFCGKVIQDKIYVVENGCYTQKVGGYDVQICVCRSKGLKNEIPCNSSGKKIYYSLQTIVLIVLVPYLQYLNS